MKNIAILAEKRAELKLLKKQIKIHSSSNTHIDFLQQGNYNGLGIVLLETGVGSKKIEERILNLFKNYSIDAAIFIGFLGALEKGLKSGDIIIPDKFISIAEEAEVYYPSPELVNLSKIIKQRSYNLYFNKVNLTVDKVYFRNEKINLLQTHPTSSSIDMESFYIAKIFSKEKIPFIAVKAVSEEWDFSLNNLEILCDQEYRTNFMRLILYCINRPSQILNLLTLIKNCKVAMANNINFLNNFLTLLL